MDKYLQIENVGMAFEKRGVRFEALRDISLAVKAGEFVSLIGHSGCGKSTLLNLVAGLLRPTAGHLLLAELAERELVLERAAVVDIALFVEV